MGEKRSKYINRIAGIVSLALLLSAIAVVHDMQTFEGVGLFFALKTGKERLIYDVMADVAALAGMFLLVFLPCLLMRHRSACAFLRMLIGFLAFMPSLSIAHLIHLFEPGEWELEYRLPMFVLNTVFPFACLLLAAVSISEKPWKKWYFGVIAAAAAFLAGGLWEAEVFGFLLVYVMLLLCFDLWERLLFLYPKLQTFGWLLFGGFLLRALYQLMTVKAIY